MYYSVRHRHSQTMFYEGGVLFQRLVVDQIMQYTVFFLGTSECFNSQIECLWLQPYLNINHIFFSNGDMIVKWISKRGQHLSRRTLPGHGAGGSFVHKVVLSECVFFQTRLRFTRFCSLSVCLFCRPDCCSQNCLNWVCVFCLQTRVQFTRLCSGSTGTGPSSTTCWLCGSQPIFHLQYGIWNYL